MCVIRKFWWHCDKHFIYCTRKKGPAGRNSGFLLPEKLKNCILNEKLNPFFFLSGFFFTDTDNSQDSRGREGTIFYSTLPLPPAHEHSDIYLQLCMWDDYHIFNRTACIYQAATRWDLPPYRITIWSSDDVMLIVACLLVDLILGFVTAIWHEKPVDSNSHRLSSMYYKQTD